MHLIGVGVLDDFGAEVGGLDGAEILLVALAVARVLEQHVRRPRLNLDKKNRRTETGEGGRERGREGGLSPFWYLAGAFFPLADSQFVYRQKLYSVQQLSSPPPPFLAGNIQSTPQTHHFPL